MKNISDAEALREIEALVEQYRGWRSLSDEPEHRTYLALKHAADDIRGRQPDTKATAGREIRLAVEGALETKTREGYASGHLIRIGQEVIARWPTLRQWLKQFEETPRSPGVAQASTAGAKNPARRDPED